MFENFLDFFYNFVFSGLFKSSLDFEAAREI